MELHSLIALAAFIVLCLTVGGFAGFATMSSVKGWYQTIAKPGFNPPNWLFGPVWTILYVLMAVAAWLVWRKVGLADGAMALFLLQLALNFAWSFIFFRAHAIGWALLDILALWLAIAATIFAFSGIDAMAAWLLAPYLAWVSFACLLNASIWRLN